MDMNSARAIQGIGLSQQIVALLTSGSGGMVDHLVLHLRETCHFFRG